MLFGISALGRARGPKSLTTSESILTLGAISASAQASGANPDQRFRQVRWEVALIPTSEVNQLDLK